MFSLEAQGTGANRLCLLGGKDSAVIEDQQISSTLHIDGENLANMPISEGRGLERVNLTIYLDALVPKHYVFAMVTGGKLHFLRKLNRTITFEEASDNCERDGGGRLVQDDGNQAWHDTIVSFIGLNDSWIGAHDKNKDGVYTWSDGLFRSHRRLFSFRSFPKVSF